MSFLAPASPKHRHRRQRAIADAATLLPDFTTMVANIRATYESADATDHAPWYHQAHDYALSLAAKHDLPFTTTAGVLAALSPGTSWERNMFHAADFLETGDTNHAYGDPIRKARAITATPTDPLTVLRGRKVRSFYHNIISPDTSRHVTVDRHALSIAVLPLSDRSQQHKRRTATLPDRELKILERPGVYQLVAGAYRAVARAYGVLPHEVQSATWSYHRRTVAYRVTSNF